MIQPLAKPEIDPQELLAMEDAASYELVDGRLVERNVSVLSSLVEGLVYEKVQGHARANQLGKVWPGTLGLQCFPDQPKKVRRPDVSFIKGDRITAELLEAGHSPLAPDLAVEVISPGDLAHEVAEKIEDYLQAGTQLIWVIEPELRIVDIYRRDGSIARLRATDELSGEDVLPGFRCVVADLISG